MGELLLVITLLTLIVLTIRRGKPVVLDNAVIIHRPGQYHILLAPQLNRAQHFIEQIAKQFLALSPPHGDLPSQYYEIHDPRVFTGGERAYLLAVSLRDGMLHFQAINPQPLIYDADSHYKTVREFAEIALEQYPQATLVDEQWMEKLRDLIQEISAQMKITATRLSVSD